MGNVKQPRTCGEVTTALMTTHNTKGRKRGESRRRSNRNSHTNTFGMEEEVPLSWRGAGERRPSIAPFLSLWQFPTAANCFPHWVVSREEDAINSDFIAARCPWDLEAPSSDVPEGKWLHVFYAHTESRAAATKQLLERQLPSAFAPHRHTRIGRR